MGDRGYPQPCYCMITQALMVDPVIDAEGNSYERDAIERWLQTNSTSPVTRNPLRRQDLRENLGIRETIRQITAARQQSSAAPAQNVSVVPSSIPGISDSGGVDFSISACDVEGSPNEKLVLLESTQPEGSTRTPSDVVCVVDISGSMGGEATLATATGAKESHGLSLLDIVKHAVRTVAHSLTQDDRLAVVVYATAARVLFPLKTMDAAGKAEAERLIATLNPEDTTNIWDGLIKAIDELNANSVASGRMSAILLLTDGLPNVEPPRGTLPMLKRYKETNNLPCASIGTFGFGYSLDSALLEGIAKEGNGMYAFIPDASFVGTAFVNAVSNLLTTVGKNVQITIEPKEGVSIEPEEIGFPVTRTPTGGLVIQSGTIHYGQNRSCLVRLTVPPGSGSGPASNWISAKITYELPGRQIRETPATVRSGDNSATIKMNRFRQLFVSTVLNSITMMKSSEMDRAQNAVKELIRQIQGSGSQVTSSEWTKGLLQDLEGQVTAALSRKDWFQKWGVHYLPSLARAHILQQCNNFKDPGVQLYGGSLFRHLRDEADDVFCKLPPPTPSIQPRSYASSSSASAPPPPRPVASMAVYNNADNPCFTGSSLISMADGTVKSIALLRKGDNVMNGRGGVATIACIVETQIPSGLASLVRVGHGLEVTPWHPIKGSDGIWRFPCEVSDVEVLVCNSVYSLVLEEHCDTIERGLTSQNDAGVIIGGVECATLGHGIRDNVRLIETATWTGYSNVIWHDYFGSRKVIQDISSLPGWSNGHIKFSSGCMVRDDTTGRLVAFSSEATLSQEVATF